MITLYNIENLRPTDNMYIDDIETFLGTVTNVSTIEDFQYIKHGLNISIKIPVTDANVDYERNPWTYVRVENLERDTNVFYYYVISAEWVARGTVRLNLMMDTINSLGQGETPCNPRNFSPETQIMREHRDRFVKPDFWDPFRSGQLVRIVDRVSEGISFNMDKGTDLTVRVDKDLDWYLIYNTEAAGETETSISNNPIRTYLAASQPLTIKWTTSGNYQEFRPNNVQNGTYTIDLDEAPTTVIIRDTDGVNYTIRSNEKVILSLPTASFLGRVGVINKINFINEGGGDLIVTLQFTLGQTIALEKDIPNYPNLSNWFKRSGDVLVADSLSCDYVRITEGKNYYINDGQYSITAGNIVVDSAESIDKLNRTLPTIIKIIKLPYCPIQYEWKGGFNYALADPRWQTATSGDQALVGFLRYTGLGLPEFINDNLPSIDITPDMYYQPAVVDSTNNKARITQPKQLEAESKLYHSDFHTIKLLYDSFSKTIDCERFMELRSSNIPLSFKPTATINSKFGFKTDVDTSGNYFHDGDYDDYLMVSRNNEELIMNSEYINYIKNGYNYDKKANSLAVENATRSAVFQTIGATFNIASAGMTGYYTLASAPIRDKGGKVSASKALALGQAVGQAGSAFGSASNVVDSWIALANLKESQQNATAQKLSQLQNQSASIAGSDDVDLMSWYSDNRLHVTRYDVPQFVQKSLYNVFDFTGYKTERYGVPSVDSRIWYNFIQCSPILLTQGYGQYQQDWLNDLRLRYQQGVTVYHHQRGEWDFSQQYENWESWIDTFIGV